MDKDKSTKIYKNGQLYDGKIETIGHACYKIFDQETKNLTTLNGYFQNNKLNGCMIFDQTQKYLKYVGEIKIQKNQFFMQEFGILYYKDGKKFIGNLQNKTNSYAYYENLKYKYFGKFEKGKIHGFGEKKNQDMIFVGEFENGKKNGNFKVFLQKNQENQEKESILKDDYDYLYFQGNYQNDIINNGILYPQSLIIQSIESNQFTQNLQPKGVSTINLTNKKQIICNITEIYENDQINVDIKTQGYIIFNDNQNSQYVGEIQNFQMHGKGVLRRNGIIRYEGQFKNGKITGFGKLMLGNQQIIIGTFESGIAHGFCIRFDLDRIIQGLYINGRIKQVEEININKINLNQFI